MTDRRASCLHQAALCEQRARLDRAEMRTFWLAEAVKWRRRAAEEAGLSGIETQAPERGSGSAQPRGT